MTKILIFSICSVLIFHCAESCYIPESVYVPVPQSIPAGYQITKVETEDCDVQSLLWTVEDPEFSIDNNGVIETLTQMFVPSRGRTFSVRVQDNSGTESEMEVHLYKQTIHQIDHSGQVLLKRSKRRWSPLPIHILENDSGPFPKKLDEVVSSEGATRTLYYTISGDGVDAPPVGLFTLNEKTGALFAHHAVDREQYPELKIWIRAYDSKTKQEADKALDFKIVVDDVNDNEPEFQGQLQFTIPEKSIVGAAVGIVNATDRDAVDTDHVRIKFTLLDGLNFFNIHPEKGLITTAVNTLDREVQETHKVTVKIQDMKGASHGLSSTATATITLSDVNDNPPTFKKPVYEATVQENEEKLILRIPVEDKDLINTPNWFSKFVITKGNESGHFQIDTDKKTNEALLYVVKHLDYETTKEVQLEIEAQNEVELVGTDAKWHSVLVNVHLTDVDEGPEFSGPTLFIGVKENTPNGTVIGTYTAIDPETKSSNGITYYKTKDPAMWINLDKNTGQVKVANTIDRESKFVQNGVYNISVKAVDKSSKIGLGTIVLVIEDINDNVPKIPPNLVVCEEKDGSIRSVIVVAEDKDGVPFSSPFSFELTPEYVDRWTVKSLNGTAGVLEPKNELHKGMHEVTLIVRDLQGVGETQTTEVTICECRNGACLARQSSAALGPMGVLALLLPLFLLLLLCLLLIFFCVTKQEKVELEDMGYSGGHLLPSNTEAPGDEVDSSLIAIGMDQTLKGSTKGSMLNPGWVGNKSSSTIGGHSIHDNGMYQATISATQMQEYGSGQYEQQFGQQSGGQLFLNGMGFDYRHDSAYHRTWQTNGIYLQGKLDYLRKEGDERYADDIIHSYGYEGTGSVAGSVGCGSDYGDTDNLEFLNTLGPKFKYLADVCKKT